MKRRKLTKTRTRRGRKQDRKLAARVQPHEVAYLAKKFGLSRFIVRGAIGAVGHSRKKVEQELSRWVEDKETKERERKRKSA